MVTEYDLMLRALAQRGVEAVDLRPPLAAANAANPVYRRTDTHWNKLGALVGYNATVSALGKPDWVIEPARVLRGFVPVAGGDLARLLAISGDVLDEDADMFGPRLVASRLRAHVKGQEVTIGQIGCVLGTHAGPKALGVVYIKK